MAKPGTNATLIATNPFATDLVAAYLFNEDTGTTITDYSGNSHSGEVENSGSPPDDSWWEAFDSDHDPAFLTHVFSARNWVKILDHADFDFAGDFSIAIGYAAAPSLMVASDTICSKASTDSWNDGWNIYTATTGKWRAGFVASTFANAAVDADTNPSYSNTSYHQMVCTYNVTDADSFVYIDGAQVASETTQAARTNNSADVYLGRAANAAQRNYEGYIFYAYFWSRQLSSSEVVSLYNNPYGMFSATALPATTLVALQGRPSKTIPLLELDIGGTARKYSVTNAASVERGFYEHRLIEAGSIRRAVSDSNFSMPRDSATVTLVDHDRAIEALLYANLSTVVNTPARILLADPDVDPDDWYTLFSGIIEEFGTPSANRWTFNLRRDDLAFNSRLKIPDIQAYDWPNAPSESIGARGQVVYGIHDSTGTGFTGMIPTTYVDNSGFRYLVSYGRLKDITDVFVDGVSESAANWDMVYEITNGREWTLIDFTSDQGDAVITCDVQGVDQIGDGSGGVLQSPPQLISHALNNFIFQNWTNGDWLPVSARLASEYLFEAQAYFDNLGISTGAMVIDGEMTGIEMVNTWANMFNIYCFWTSDGRFAMVVDDYADEDVYTTAAHFRQELSPEPEFRSVEFNSRELEDSVKGRYIYSHADNDYFAVLTVKDATKDYGVSSEIDIKWIEPVV